MTGDLKHWLEGLGLGTHAELLEDHGIDLDVLPHVTEPELRELGLPFGACRKIALRLAGGGAGSEPQAPAEREAPATEGERRQVTVLFCDLVGSTALSAAIDPEDYRDVLRAYQDACAGEVARQDGYVAQFLGDGILAYFGWPRAHEDDVARAVRAGLDLVDAVGALPTKAPTLRVRVGIATGSVVIGDLIGTESAQQAAVTGETPNRAARLQALAEPDHVVIDCATRSLVGGAFDLRSLGPQALRGIEAPIPAFDVRGVRRVESRFAAERGGSLTPLIGRDEELELLSRRWRDACEGRGAVVLLSGEAGIGKSRLAQALRESTRDAPHAALLFQCAPQYTHSALHPVVHEIEFDAGLEDGETDSVRREKLERLLRRAGPGSEALLPYAAALLSIPLPDQPLPEMSPKQQMTRTIEALVDHVRRLAERAPVLLILEDAHWIDPTSLELMGHLVERVRDLPALVVVTYRPEFQAPWVGGEHVTLIALRRLRADDRARLARAMFGSQDVGGDALRQIAERSDGIPLFIEELARAVRDADDGKGAKAIPPTLHDALEARLDGSAAVREVAQAGAAIGREFGHALVLRVVGLERETLDGALGELETAGLLFASGKPPDARYVFKHALIQDTAYATLLRSRREALHRSIAEALETDFPERAHAEPEVVAYHFTEAGDADRAIPLWREAGRRASTRSACIDACAHLDQALALVPRLPESKRQQVELELLMAKSPALVFLEGMASEPVGALNERATALAEATGNRELGFRAAFQTWNYQIQFAPLSKAIGIAERLERLAAESGSVDQEIQAHHARWTTHFLLGEVAEADRHAVAGEALYDPEQHGHHCQLFAGHDPGVCAHGFGAMALWVLGRPADALASLERGFAVSDAVGHRVSEGTLLAWGALVHVLCGRFEEARDAAQRTVETSERFGLAFAVPNRQILAAAEAGLAPGRPVPADVIELVSHPSPAGMEISRPAIIAEIAGRQREAGHDDDAEALLEIGFGVVDYFESHWARAELLRQRGELHRKRGDLSAAARDLAAALAEARAKAQNGWALRAAISLTQFERDRGRAAGDLLAPIVAAFDDGLETADLREARALLSALGNPAT